MNSNEKKTNDLDNDKSEKTIEENIESEVNSNVRINRAKLLEISKSINIEREDPGAIDTKEYRMIPKLKIKSGEKKKRPAYDKLFPGIG